MKQVQPHRQPNGIAASVQKPSLYIAQPNAYETSPCFQCARRLRRIHTLCLRHSESLALHALHQPDMDVHQRHIIYLVVNWRLVDAAGEERASDVLDRLLVPFLDPHRLRKLRCLTIARFDLEYTTVSLDLFQKLVALSSVAKLTLRKNMFASFEQFQDIICSFSALSSLSMEDNYTTSDWGVDLEPSHSAPPVELPLGLVNRSKRPHLSSLRLHPETGNLRDALPRWLASTPTLHSLVLVSIDISFHDDFGLPDTVTAEMLLMFGQNVRNLALPLSDFGSFQSCK